MIKSEEIRNYGNASITKWVYYDCPPDCANRGNNRISFEVMTANGDPLDAFGSFKAAKKFAQRWMLNQHIFKKAQEAAEILNHYDTIEVIAPNCEESICIDADFNEKMKMCSWCEDCVIVENNFPVQTENGIDLPLDIQHKMIKKRIVMFTGDHALAYGIVGVTDVWTIAPNVFVVEAEDGRTYFICGINAEKSCKALNKVIV